MSKVKQADISEYRYIFNIHDGKSLNVFNHYTLSGNYYYSNPSSEEPNIKYLMNKMFKDYKSQYYYLYNIWNF